MFSLPYYIAQEILQLPTKHSWLASLSMLPIQQWEQKGNEIDYWIENKVNEIFPNASQTERIVRYVYSLFLEREAIRLWISLHPNNSTIELYDARQAAEIGAKEIMYVEQSDIDNAVIFLQLLDESCIIPDYVKETELDILSVIGKLAYKLVSIGYDTFVIWFQQMHKQLYKRLNFHYNTIDADMMIRDMWDTKVTRNGERRKISEWADIYKNNSESNFNNCKQAKELAQIIIGKEQLQNILPYFAAYITSNLDNYVITDEDVENGFVEYKEEKGDKLLFKCNDKIVTVSSNINKLSVSTQIQIIYSNILDSFNVNFYELAYKLSRCNTHLLYFIERRFFGYEVYNLLTMQKLFDIAAYPLREEECCGDSSNKFIEIELESHIVSSTILKLSLITDMNYICDSWSDFIWFHIKNNKCTSFVSNISKSMFKKLIFNTNLDGEHLFFISPSIIENYYNDFENASNKIYKVEYNSNYSLLTGGVCKYNTFSQNAYDSLIKNNILEQNESLFLNNCRNSFQINISCLRPILNRILRVCNVTHMSMCYKNGFLTFESFDENSMARVCESLEAIGNCEEFMIRIYIPNFMRLIENSSCDTIVVYNLKNYFLVISKTSLYEERSIIAFSSSI